MRISVYDDMRAALDSALAACAASERRELELTDQLAAANALLGETKTLLHRVHGFQIVGMSGERALGLERDIKAIFPALHAHLSAQPAAPTDHDRAVEEPESEWEAEQQFWREHPIDRFDLEECGSAYSSHRDMQLNETGDWVRAEDHRKTVAELARREAKR